MDEPKSPSSEQVPKNDEARPVEAVKRKPYKPRPKEEQYEFRLKVARMRLQGLEWMEISRQLGEPISTCRYAYRAFSEDYRHQYLKQQNEILTDFHRRMELNWNAHFASYVASLPKDEMGKPIQSQPGKVEFLREACKIELEKFDRLQSAGFLPKVKEKLEVQGELDLKAWAMQFFDKKPAPPSQSNTQPNEGAKPAPESSPKGGADKKEEKKG